MTEYTQDIARDGSGEGLPRSWTETIDTGGLLVDLRDKAVLSCLDIVNARRAHDARAIDEALLRMRASALLLASIPAPDWDSMGHKATVAAMLRAEDDDVLSHACRMIELAIRIDTDALQALLSL